MTDVDPDASDDAPPRTGERAGAPPRRATMRSLGQIVDPVRTPPPGATSSPTVDEPAAGRTAPPSRREGPGSRRRLAEEVSGRAGPGTFDDDVDVDGTEVLPDPLKATPTPTLVEALARAAAAATDDEVAPAPEIVPDDEPRLTAYSPVAAEAEAGAAVDDAVEDAPAEPEPVEADVIVLDEALPDDVPPDDTTAPDADRPLVRQMLANEVRDGGRLSDPKDVPGIIMTLAKELPAAAAVSVVRIDEEVELVGHAVDSFVDPNELAVVFSGVFRTLQQASAMLAAGPLGPVDDVVITAENMDLVLRPLGTHYYLLVLEDRQSHAADLDATRLNMAAVSPGLAATLAQLDALDD